MTDTGHRVYGTRHAYIGLAITAAFGAALLVLGFLTRPAHAADPRIHATRSCDATVWVIASGYPPTPVGWHTTHLTATDPEHGTIADRDWSWRGAGGYTTIPTDPRLTIRVTVTGPDVPSGTYTARLTAVPPCATRPARAG